MVLVFVINIKILTLSWQILQTKRLFTIEMIHKLHKNNTEGLKNFMLNRQLKGYIGGSQYNITQNNKNLHLPYTINFESITPFIS